MFSTKIMDFVKQMLQIPECCSIMMKNDKRIFKMLIDLHSAVAFEEAYKIVYYKNKE